MHMLTINFNKIGNYSDVVLGMRWIYRSKYFVHTYSPEAVVRRCSAKKVFLEISQNSQENTCARDSF